MVSARHYPNGSKLPQVGWPIVEEFSVKLSESNAETAHGRRVIGIMFVHLSHSKVASVGKTRLRDFPLKGAWFAFQPMASNKHPPLIAHLPLCQP